jgi:hypothetical protein
MARGDSPADRPSGGFGKRSDGSYLLPGGRKLPNEKALVAYLRGNPGWVYKNRGWVMSQVGDQFTKAGYVGKPGSAEMQQFSKLPNDPTGRLVHQWFPAGSSKAKTAQEHPDSYSDFGINVTKVGPGGKQTKIVSTKPGGKGAGKPGKPAAPPATGTGKGTVTTAGAPTTTGSPLLLPDIDISGLLGLGMPKGTIIPLDWAKQGAQPLDSKKAAAAAAGAEFDPVIADIVAARGVGQRQNRQNERDIGNFYEQVLGSQRTAAQRDAAISDAGVSSIRDASTAIIESLGGEANAGAGMVGAAAQSAVGTLDALGVAQDQYNQDVRPLLQAESAGALARERAMGTARLHDLAVKLASTRGQKGQAMTAKQFEFDQLNNQILDNRLQARLGIVQANNATRQQGFANQFGLEQAKIAAASTGAKLVTDILQDQRKAEAAAQKGKGKKPYASTSASMRQDAFDDWADRVDQLKSQGYTAQDAMRAAATFFPRAYGWSVKNPAVNARAQAIVSAAYK